MHVRLLEGLTSISPTLHPGEFRTLGYPAGDAMNMLCVVLAQHAFLERISVRSEISSPAKGAALQGIGVQDDREGAVIDEGHCHVCPEAAAGHLRDISLGPADEVLVESLRLLRWSCPCGNRRKG